MSSPYSHSDPFFFYKYARLFDDHDRTRIEN